MSLLIVEQNAGLSLALGRSGLRAGDRHDRGDRYRRRTARRRHDQRGLPGGGELMDFSLFVERFINGVADGSIYALLALALVVIFRSTGQLNFAQGEIGTMGAFFVSTLTLAGLPVLLAILLGTGARVRRSAPASSASWSGRSRNATRRGDRGAHRRLPRHEPADRADLGHRRTSAARACSPTTPTTSSRILGAPVRGGPPRHDRRADHRAVPAVPAVQQDQGRPRHAGGGQQPGIVEPRRHPGRAHPDPRLGSLGLDRRAGGEHAGPVGRSHRLAHARTVPARLGRRRARRPRLARSVPSSAV